MDQPLDPQPASGAGHYPDQRRGEPLRPRTVRFSGAEWALVEQAAARQGLTARGLVRASARAFAEKKPSERLPAALSPGHLALIEAPWRAVHLLATLATRQMRYEEIDDLGVEAHNAMRQIMTGDPDRTPPGKAPSLRRRQPKGKA